MTRPAATSSAPTADVVVIGGGVMGLFTALELVAAGVRRVVLLEKTDVGAGSSGKSGAILRQHYSHETTIAMARTSLAAYRDFEADHGLDIGFRELGMVFVGPGSNRPALEANVRAQRALGVVTEVVGADELRILEPAARFEDDEVAAFEPEAATVDPGRTLHALLALARGAGVDVRPGTGARGLVRAGDGAVTGVELTDGASLGAGAVVAAAGPWTGRLCRDVGIDLPLRAIRPEQAYFAPPADRASERLVFGDLRTGLYWKPEIAGWIRVGRLDSDDDRDVPDPDRYDEGVSDAFLRDCRRRMTERLPRYATAVSWGGCGALYTMTPDSHAIIGPVAEAPGLLVVSGFSGHGFKLGPSVGRGVAGLITGGDTGPMDPAFFAADRFGRDAAVRGAYAYGILG